MRKLLGVTFVLLILASASFGAIAGLNPEVKSSLVKVGSDVVVPAGANVQSAVAVGSNIDIAGTVNKDAVAVGGNLTIRKSGVVRGDAVCIGGTLIKEPGATISGDTIQLGVENLPGAVIGKGFGWSMPLFSVISFISFLILALFTASFFPIQVGRNSYFIERLPGQSLLWGLLMIVLVVPIIILLAISLIGIAFVPAYIILLAAASFFGYVAISQLIGKKVLKSLRMRNKPMMTEIIVGFVFFEIIALIPIIGWLIKLIATTMGLGAVYSTRFGTKD